jgi:hypothetical protein
MSMLGWTLETRASAKALAAAMRTELEKRGFQVGKMAATDGTTARVFSSSGGSIVMVEYGRPDPSLARAIVAVVGGTARFLEVTLEDTKVSATLTHLPEGGTEDLDDTAFEILHDWNEGERRKFRSEAFAPLSECLLGLDGVTDGKPVAVITFRSTASSRVAMLLLAVANGATWERISMSGQSAIRVKGATGTQISVLKPDEEAEFLSAVGAT